MGHYALTQLDTAHCVVWWDHHLSVRCCAEPILIPPDVPVPLLPYFSPVISYVLAAAFPEAVGRISGIAALHKPVRCVICGLTPPPPLVFAIGLRHPCSPR